MAEAAGLAAGPPSCPVPAAGVPGGELRKRRFDLVPPTFLGDEYCRAGERVDPAGAVAFGFPPLARLMRCALRTREALRRTIVKPLPKGEACGWRRRRGEPERRRADGRLEKGSGHGCGVNV